MADRKKYRFRAVIHAGDRSGAFILFPYDTEREFGIRGKVPVAVTFDGVLYHGALIRCGNALHMLGLLKRIRLETKKSAGDLIDVVLWKDEEPRKLEIPADFEARMREAEVRSIFEELSYTRRKEFCNWIAGAQREETRLKRLKKSIEMLQQKTFTGA